MSRHSFDPDIAKQVGVNAAVIFSNICWWCERNAVKGRNIHDGNAWTFNSIKVMEDLFGYLTQRQIRHAVQKLEDAGLIEAGNFNRDNRDRTKWYSLKIDTEAFYNFVSPHLTKLSTPTFDKIVKPLPDVKEDSKHTPIVPKGTTDLFSADNETSQDHETADSIQEGFKEFWNEIWPSHKRKVGKSDCALVYRQACEGKHKKADQIAPADLNRCARAYITSVKDMEFLKGPLAWLRQPGWEPFLDQRQVFSEDDLTVNQRNQLQYGDVPPSMRLPDGRPNEAARYWLKTYGFEEEVHDA